MLQKVKQSKYKILIGFYKKTTKRQNDRVDKTIYGQALARQS